MKNTIIMIIVLIIAPLIVHADETVAVQNDQAHTTVPSAATVAPEERALVEMHALIAADSRLTGFSETGIIGTWRERVFKTMAHVSHDAVRYAAEPDDRLLSHQDLAERSQEGRILTRTVLNETLKFAQERLPEIDKLVKSLRLEVSTEMLSKESGTAEPGVEDRKETPAGRRTPRDRFLVKTGLRVPVESGKLNLLSETDAVYGTLSTFFKIYIDGRYDNSVGIAYAFANDVRLQVEQRAVHTGTAEGTQELSHLSMMQLVCTF